MADIKNDNVVSNNDVEDSTTKKPWYKKVGNYFALIFRDMVRAIKDKPSIIFGLLVCVPGIFIGLFLNSHIAAAAGLEKSYSLAGIVMFGMVLVGCINMTNGFAICTNRRLKSSILAAISTVLVDLLGVYWIYCFASSKTVWNPDYDFAGPATSSIICLVISIVCSTVGAIGSFFTYDHNYKKDDR